MTKHIDYTIHAFNKKVFDEALKYLYSRRETPFLYFEDDFEEEFYSDRSHLLFICWYDRIEITDFNTCEMTFKGYCMHIEEPYYDHIVAIAQGNNTIIKEPKLDEEAEQSLPNCIVLGR